MTRLARLLVAVGLCFALAWSAVGALIVAMAMWTGDRDGRITLRFDAVGEGRYEFGMLVFAALCGLVAVRYAARLIAQGRAK